MMLDLRNIDWYTTVCSLLSELVIAWAAFKYVKFRLEHRAYAHWLPEAMVLWVPLVFASMAYLVFMDMAVNFTESVEPLAVMVLFCLGIYSLARFCSQQKKENWYTQVSFASAPIGFFGIDIPEIVMAHMLLVILSVSVLVAFGVIIRVLLRYEDPIKGMEEHPWPFLSWIFLSLILWVLIDAIFIHLGFIMVIFIVAFWIWIGMIIALAVRGALSYLAMVFFDHA